MPIPTNAQDYYALVKSKSRQYPVVGLQREIDAVIETFPDGEAGLRAFIQWLLACPLPGNLGLVDGTDFDTLVRGHIDNLQKTLEYHGFAPEVLPEDAPKIARKVEISPGMFIDEGGSNRAQAAATKKYQKETKAKKAENTTDGCKALLAKAHKGDPILGTPKNWKRVSKHGNSSDNARVFQNGSVFKTVSFNLHDHPATVIHDGNLFPKDPEQAVLIDALKKAAATIKHSGEYGHLYFSPSKSLAYWSGSDGDGYEENGHTTFDEIEAMLRVPGIKGVEVEAEHNPSVSEGFLFLGKFGITVNEDDE